MFVQGSSGLAIAMQSLYGVARIGDIVVNRNHRPSSQRWAFILIGAAVLALGGCGRKGPLDLPPTGTSPSSSVAPTETEADAASRPSVFNPNYGTDAPPSATKGIKRPFILDPLLGN
jgi:predicted small lipoprotein YifL